MFYLLVNFLKMRFKNKKGATVLETVLLIVVAVIIIFALFTFFYGKGADDPNSVVGKIILKIKEMLQMNSENKPNP